MKIKTLNLASLMAPFACAVLFFNAVALAEENIPSVTGTWGWSVPGRNGGPERVNRLTLRADGDKLTGKLSAPGRDGQKSDTPITGGKVEGDRISFSIVREFNGTSTTNAYTGKVSADKITGKTEFTRNGEAQSRDWEAKRVADDK